MAAWRKEQVQWTRLDFARRGGQRRLWKGCRTHEATPPGHETDNRPDRIVVLV